MKHFLSVALLVAPALGMAGDFTVGQKNKAFTQASLNIKVGDKVAFRNDDTFAHNVFSLSDPMNFDLGTYAQGQSKSVTFAQAGTYEVECAIHPEMKMVINVKP
jgi:plastocyanin